MSRKSIGLIAAVLLVAAAAAVSAFSGRGGAKPEYRTVTLDRGNILKSVSASGELNPLITVDVSSEISGQVSELLVDFNSEVRAGQVIARIDPESFEAELRASEAELAVARAAINTKIAAVAQAKANLGNAGAGLLAERAALQKARVTAADLKLEHGRKWQLRESGVVAAAQVDKARAAMQGAAAEVSAADANLRAQASAVAARRAQLQMAGAEVGQARAQAKQRQAALAIAKVNLARTFIRSPVDGVVIGRDVDLGQTVAASFQAPTLFTIAKDLRRMQVETNIDEADIGQIRPGQSAAFRVDSYPGRQFEGTVIQVRKKPQTVQNVVTYTVVIAADNADLALLPGMTADVQVKISNRANVVRIPSAALRFNPPSAAPPAARSHGQARRGSGPPDAAARRARARQRLARLAKALGLNEAQQDQVQGINRQTFQRIRALRQAGGGGGDFANTVRQLRRALGDKILAILDPEQQKKFRALIAGRRANRATPGRVWVLADGKPKPVEVMIGAGDGRYFELVRGELQAGAVVVTGLQDGAKSGGSRFFRFGL